MDHWQQSLSRWESKSVTTVRIDQVHVKEYLQPRHSDNAAAKELTHLEKASKGLVVSLRRVLQAERSAVLTPILLANVDGLLYLVDGHHRLKAYKLEKRLSVPARVREMSMSDAVMLSKIVNTTDVRLPMTGEQRSEALWQMLAATSEGRNGRLPPGCSFRKLQATFNVAVGTIQKMVARLPAVDPAQYSDAEKDAGTGWPRWRHARRDTKYELATDDDRLTKQARKFAAVVSTLRQKYSYEERALGFQMLLQDGEGEEAEEEFASFGYEAPDF